MAIAGVSLNAVTLVNLVICVGIAVEFCAHIARAFQFPSASLLDQSGAVSSRYFSLNKASDSGNRPAMSSALTGMDARVWAAMSQVGGSVFSGITITKLLGVCVLAFTRSKIFEIYYFRVWLALVLLAASHALVLLPVLLSWFGGPKGIFTLFLTIFHLCSLLTSVQATPIPIVKIISRRILRDDDDIETNIPMTTTIIENGILCLHTT